MKKKISFAIVICLLFSLTAFCESWRVPMIVSNSSGAVDTVYFGIHPQGSPGLDPELGEVNLPPPPPLSVFEARFLVPGYEGFTIDIRDTTNTARTHNLKWQAGGGGYPVTIAWCPDSLGIGLFQIVDPFGGIFIPPVDMTQDSSITIPPEQYFITQLNIEVIPGFQTFQPPEIQPIPEQKIFSGQRFPHLLLNDYVYDPDTPVDDLTWEVTAGISLQPIISFGVQLDIDYPEGWIGSEMIFLSVHDPEGNIDSSEIIYAALEPGVLRWTVPLTVTDASSEQGEASFGVDPEGTFGLDPQLGELNLPPMPPIGIFDLRFEISPTFTSILDIRENTATSRIHILRWQTGTGGYPVAVNWDNLNLPAGELYISDQYGGFYIPLTDMHSTSEIIVSAYFPFINSLQIQVTPEIDTDPPVGPDSLWMISISDSTMTLGWTTAVDSNFAYYEIKFDTVQFTTSGKWIWDWSDDFLLTNIETTSTVVNLPIPNLDYFSRIRAWDTFGNMGNFSNITSVVAVIDDLIISISGNDIILNWTAPEGTNGNYTVYRNINPYFSPSTAQSVFSFSGPTSGQVLWTDFEAILMNNRYFYIATYEY